MSKDIKENRKHYYLREEFVAQKKKDGKIEEIETIGRPIATVAVIGNDDGTFCRGIAVCSPLDNMNKKSGRRIAFQRAEYALKQCHSNIANSLPIGEDTQERLNMLHDDRFEFKSSFISSEDGLTDFEKQIMEDKEQGDE